MPFRRLFPTVLSHSVHSRLRCRAHSRRLRAQGHPEPVWEQQANELIDQAESFYSKKQYAQAIKTTDDFLIRYPKSRHGDRALRLLGEIRLTQRDYRQALSYYKEIIERYPASPFIPDAKYELGQMLLRTQGI